MSNIDTLLNEFIDAWNAGQRPTVDAYIAQADPDDRDELRGALGTWLAVAPTPDYDEATISDIRTSPALIAALAEPVGARVATLRTKSGLALTELAAKISNKFGLGENQRVEQYLTELEAGELEENRLSRRLLTTLGDILGGTLQPPPQAAPAGLFRADGDVDGSLSDQFAVLSQAALTSAPEASMDAIDQLFLGGPEG